MAQTAQLRRIEHAQNEAQRVFQLQRAAYLAAPYPSLEERRERLRAVERVLLDDRDAIAEAIHRDFGHRCTEESLLLELFTCVDGIRHTIKKLPRWMRPERRSVSLLFATGRNRVIPQPKGVVGIGPVQWIATQQSISAPLPRRLE
jgi:coniferyl-aldehyde dehydrogenase